MTETLSAPLFYWTSPDGRSVRSWSESARERVGDPAPEGLPIDAFVQALGLPLAVVEAHRAAAQGIAAHLDVPWGRGTLRLDLLPTSDGAVRVLAWLTAAPPPPACWIDVAEGRTARADPNAAAFFGRGDLVGIDLFELLDAEVRGPVEAVLESGSAGRLTVRHHGAARLAELFLDPPSGRGSGGQAWRLTFCALRPHPVVDRELSRLASYVQQHPHPVAEVTAGSGLRFVNDAARRELPGLEERGMDHPFLSGLPLLARTIAAGGPGQRCVLLPDGRRFEQHARRLPSGGVRVYAHEVTPAARAAATLREKVAESERLRAAVEVERDFAETLIDALGEPLIIADSGNRVRFANRAAEELTGRERGSLPRTSLFDLIHPDDRPALRERFSDLDARERSRHEVRLQRSDGTYRQGLLTATALVLSGGERGGVIATFTDLTEETEAQHHVETLRRFYESVLAELPIEVSVLDADGRYLYANARAVRNPLHRHELLGKRPSEMVARSDDEALVLNARQTWIDTIIAQAVPMALVERIRQPSRDAWRMVEQTGTPLIDEQGHVTFVVVYGVDIGERVAYERELLAARRAAEEMDLLKTTLVANMSHEIRTPLTAIIGFADFLGDELPPGVDREPLELIRSSGMRLLSTLSDVLDSARLASGTFTLDLHTLDVRPLVREVCDRFRPEAERSGLFLTCRLDREPAQARVNAEALRRVVGNLLANAVRFTQTGGIMVEAQIDEGEVRILVSDTGSGVDPAFEPYLFEAFRQGSQGGSRTHQGSGLGLAIARGLTQTMGGAVRLLDGSGGATFAVCLPRAL